MTNQPRFTRSNHARQAGAAPERQKRSTRQTLEHAAMALMAIGFIMIFQPVSKTLFSYSFTVILAGVLLFIVISHLRE